MRLILASLVAAVMLVTAGVHGAEAAGDVPAFACLQIHKAAIRVDLATDSAGADALQDVLDALECGPIL